MRSAKSLVGVDIGSRNLRVAQLAFGRRGLEVVAAGHIPTPQGAVDHGHLVEVEAVAEALRSLCAEVGVTARHAVTAVGGPLVIVRQIEVPRVKPSQLRQLIATEARRHLPDAVRESALDYQILGPAPGEAGRQEVMLVAAQRALVEARLAVLLRAGLEPVAVDIEPYVHAYALVGLHPDPARREGRLLTVALGAQHTEVTLLQRGLVVLTRSLPSGGEQWTQALAEALHLDEREAEQLKCTASLAVPEPLPVGREIVPPESSLNFLPPTAGAETNEGFMMAPEETEGSASATSPLSSDTLGEPSPSEVSEPFPQPSVESVLGGLVDGLAQEITRTLDAYRAQQPESDPPLAVDQVVLTGGGACLSGLDAYLQEVLELPVAVAAPLVEWGEDGVPLPPEVQADLPAYTLVFGLAGRQNVVR